MIKLPDLLRVPHVSPRRKWAAIAVALIADGLQWLLAPVPLADQAIDVVVFGLEMALLGFHPLLLPTFLLELVPVADLLPTWTGCVVLVLALRKKEPPVVDVPGEKLPPPRL